jgi:hypothetical protein
MVSEVRRSEANTITLMIQGGTVAKLSLIACLVLAFSSVTAEATTIEVTNGRVSMFELGLFDTCFFTSGPALMVNICNPGSRQLMPPLGAVTMTRFAADRAIIDGVRYNGPPPIGPPPFGVLPFNLNMAFLHLPVSDGPLTTVPFTMTGTLGLLDPVTNDPIVFDLVGRGTLRCCRQPDPTGGSFQLVAVEFDFEPGPASVAEPSSMMLLVAAWPLLRFGCRRAKKKEI